MKIKIGAILRKIVFSFGVIYGINILLNNNGIHIPINIITIAIASFLGVPGLLSLFAIFYLIK